MQLLLLLEGCKGLASGELVSFETFCYAHIWFSKYCTSACTNWIIIIKHRFTIVPFGIPFWQTIPWWILYDLLFQSNTTPFQPPNDIRLIQVQPGQLTFNWTSIDAQCDSVSYSIISSNCGQCPSTTSSTNITCRDSVASGQVCSLIVQAVVCGNITGNQSSPTSVIMKGVLLYYSVRLLLHDNTLFFFLQLQEFKPSTLSHVMITWLVVY